MMKLGINTNWSLAWDQPQYFNDLAKQMGFWDDEVIAQRHGKILVMGNGVAHAALVDSNAGVKAEAGKYHVSWQGDGELAINDIFHSGKEFSFDHSGDSYIRVSFKGRSLNKLSVIREGAIGIWHPDYLRYLRTLPISVIRTMNLTRASDNIEATWSDRVTRDDISYQLGVPLEDLIDLCNMRGLDMWWNIPVRADLDYIDKAGAILGSQLKTTLIPEVGNEVWNSASGWGDCTAWISTNAPRCLAVHRDGVFTLRDHGLKTGDRVRSFSQLKNRLNNIDNIWQLSYGIATDVEVLDAYSFKLLYKGAQQFSELSEHYFCLEGGDINENYISKCEAAWAILERHIPRDRMHYTVASQYNNSWLTHERLSFLSTEIDSISIAPYYDVPLLYDSYEAHADRELLSFDAEKIAEHKVAGIQLICYEGGPHYYKSDDWLYEYWKSDECEEVIIKYIEHLEACGISLFCYYKDASITSFGLTTSPNDAIKDGRYRGFKHNRENDMTFSVNDKIEIGTEANPPRNDLRPWDGYIESINDTSQPGFPVRAMVHKWNDNQTYRPMYYSQTGLDPEGREDYNMHNIDTGEHPEQPPVAPPSGAKFQVGDSIKVGTEDHPPDNDTAPWYGRVICNDAKNHQDLTVLVLIKPYAGEMEKMHQFNSEGQSYLEILAGGGELNWHYPNYRLSHA